MPYPNILFVTADQLRKDALGCYGNDVIKTPVLDRIAVNGFRFERMFTAYPVCAPNRISLITGRYPSVHRVNNNGKVLPKSELTLMEILRREGYATYGVGKMHFGPQWQIPPDGAALINPDPALTINPQPDESEYPWYGFERVALTEDHRIGPYGDYLARYGYNVWDELHSASYPQSATEASRFPEEHHQTTWITDRTLEMLASHPADKPFFVWVSYVHPHHPFNPPVPYDQLYTPESMPLPIWDSSEVAGWPDAYRRKYFAQCGNHEAVGMCDFSDEDWQRMKAYYYGMVTQIDTNIGRIIAQLEAAGQLENTIIVFTSDHGDNLGDHHLAFKGTTYDCVTNVPLIIYPPSGRSGKYKPGKVSEGLCCTIDLMPTILEMAGIPVPDPSPLQGLSLVPAWDTPDWSVRDAILIENSGPRRSVRTNDVLLTWHGESQRGELYDLQVDPECFNNLWNQPEAADLQRQMLEKLIALMATNSDPLPVRSGYW